MSISKLTIYLSALAVLLTAVPATAQREIKHVPPFIDADGYDPDVYQPFAAPDLFDPDYQFFAPAEFTEFGRGPQAPRGWFGTYDRLYLWVTRPENQTAAGVFPGSGTSTLDEKAGDFGWGNRYDVGYMTAEDHGWLLSFWKLAGPHNVGGPIVERIDVFEPNDQVNNNPQLTVNLRGGMGGMMMMMGQNAGLAGRPERDQNDPVTGARDYRFQNTVNVAELNSFELNKTFRFTPLHYGSVVEPFFGFRYLQFNDFFGRDTYDRLDAATGARQGAGFPVGGTAAFEVEELTRLRSEFANRMVGGQIGLRWFKRKERWKLAGELRAFGFQNFQSLEQVTTVELTEYQTNSPNAQIVGVFNDATTFGDHAAEFVFGTEIRAEVAYNVTRDFALRGGMTFMELARGVGRGNSLLRNDQSVTLVGASFGFQFNR